VRTAVRRALADLPAGAVVLVACSGGPDSLALAAATAWVAERRRLRAGAVVVDHRLQPGSADVAAAAADACRSLGLDPALVVTAPPATGTRSGPEGDARARRYAALTATAERHGAVAVLLGHTRDDQAETVLLRLARGSGARSLAGMPPRRGLFRRPLLDVDRAVVHRVATALDLPSWADPHNTDDAFARSRVRARVLPTLTVELGPGVPAALARSAALLRDDDGALQGWADAVFAQARAAARPDPRPDVPATAVTPAGVPPLAPPAPVPLGATSTGARSGGSDHEPTGGTAAAPDPLPIAPLADVPVAVLRRVLRTWLLEAGVPGGALTADHLAAVARLVTRGGGPVALPGARQAQRCCARLCLVVSDDARPEPSCRCESLAPRPAARRPGSAEIARPTTCPPNDSAHQRPGHRPCSPAELT
jgi:tRNA(Ile)-lysidine synthase